MLTIEFRNSGELVRLLCITESDSIRNNTLGMDHYTYTLYDLKQSKSVSGEICPYSEEKVDFPVFLVSESLKDMEKNVKKVG